MGSRRGGGPAITLFSFQDIITSVSGILIFITLFLAVELVERVQRAGVNSAESDAADLEKAIAQAETEREELRRLIAERSSTTGASTLAGERELRESVEQIARAEQELLELDRRLSDAQAREASARTRLSGSEGQQRALRRQAAEAESLRKRLHDEQRGNRVYFQRQSNLDSIRGGWLVLLDAHAIAAAPLDRSARPVSFAGSPPARNSDAIDDAAQAFLDWVGRQADGDYLLLVARPSGLRRVGPLQDELLRRGRRFGLDLVAERQEVLDPESGVYRP